MIQYFILSIYVIKEFISVYDENYLWNRHLTYELN